MITSAVRDMKTWDLILHVEETPSRGVWGWVRHLLRLDRKIVWNRCVCGCFLRCQQWKTAGKFCRACYDVCSVAWVHPGRYADIVLLTDLR